MNEIFVDVLGYEGLYKVSNLGNVLSVKRNKLLKPGKENNGYLKVILRKNGKNKNYYVHRLVALSFLPNPLNYKEINHISEDKTDNRVENLEWCDHRYNINYGTGIQRMLQHSNWKKANEKTSKAVLCFTKQGKLIAEYSSSNEASRQTKINQSNISLCCNNKRKSAGKYLWKFKEEVA